MTVEGDHAISELVEPCVAATASNEAFAWRVHEALQDWTAKVDTKASIVMSLETALLSGIVAFSGSRTSVYPVGWALSHHCGLVLLLASIVIAGAVVFPQLRRRDSVKSWQNQIIYFGHLRKWEPAVLAEAIAGRESNVSLGMLSDQLVTMSRIAWRKHVLVQWSLLVALAGCIAVGIPLVAIV
jgi:Family of unknown function (DUF5706)